MPLRWCLPSYADHGRGNVHDSAFHQCNGLLTAVITAVIVLCRHLHNVRRQPDGQAKEGAPDMRDEGKSHE